MNIKSTEANVFPSALRTRIPNGKFINENNFINILNSIADYSNNGYVIDYNDSTQLLKLVIHGYYFELANVSLSTANLYASVVVENTSGCLVNWSTKGSTELDVSSGGDWYFMGVSISTDIPEITSDYSVYSLRITDDSEPTPKIVNKAKFKASNIRWRDGEGSEDEMSLVEKINTKENKIVTPYGSPLSVEHGEGEANAQLTINTETFLMKNESENKGNTTTPIYMNSDGIPVAITATSGSVATTSGNVTSAKSAIISNGTFNNNGQEVFMSTLGPTGERASYGKLGDLWFKYSE